MPKIILALDESGLIDGISEVDKKRWAKFKYLCANLGDGSIAFRYTLPRSTPYHRRFFKMISELFNRQEVFKDSEILRKWLELCIGHYDDYVLPDGEIKSIARSVDYDSLDQSEFQTIVDRLWEFVRSEECRKFLWPYLSNEQSYETIESLLGEFE